MQPSQYVESYVRCCFDLKRGLNVAEANDFFFSISENIAQMEVLHLLMHILQSLFDGSMVYDDFISIIVSTLPTTYILEYNLCSYTFYIICLLYIYLSYISLLSLVLFPSPYPPPPYLLFKSAVVCEAFTRTLSQD